jgi:hypothetical protein
MEKIKKTSFERIAYHEAGHAVIDVLLLLPFNAVSLETVSKESFRIKNSKKEPVTELFTEGITWPEERKESINKDIKVGNLNLREMIAAMAGPEAEKMFIGEIDDEARLGVERDVQGILACCRAAISPGVSIENWKDSVMEEYILRGIAMQANELLKDNWSSVQSVAGSLLKCKRLTHSEVKECVRVQESLSQKKERKAVRHAKKKN